MSPITRVHFDHLAHWIADNTEPRTVGRSAALAVTLDYLKAFGRNFDDERFVRLIEGLDRDIPEETDEEKRGREIL